MNYESTLYHLFQTIAFEKEMGNITQAQAELLRESVENAIDVFEQGQMILEAIQKKGAFESNIETIH